MIDLGEVHASLAFRKDRLSRLFLLVAIMAFAIGFMLIAIGFVFERTHPPKWNPLGAYPTQVIINRGHLVQPNGIVDVTAQKCARLNSVTVRSTPKEWLAVDTPGLHYVDGIGAESVRYRSCGPNAHTTTFSYHNPIPDGVADEVAKGHHVWRITGLDIPFDSSGREGVPRAWTTETFTIR